jgi:rRNA maturation RNase YbeY
MAIFFNKEDIKFELKNKLRIKKLIKDLSENEKMKIGEINFIFCSDAFLLEMNKKYLNHDYFTDVITFDYSENGKISGDIFISLETVFENAEKYESEKEDELHRVMFHGVLHLTGYKDKNNEDKKIMTEKENFYLDIFKNQKV